MANQGGRYVVDGSGKKELVERTDWQPPAKPASRKKPNAPVMPDPTTPEKTEVNDNVLS